MSAAAEPPPRFGRHDVIRLACVAWLVVALFLWLAFVELHWDTQMSARDHYCFVRAGELLEAGDSAYAQRDRAFANPPFTFPIVRALGALGTQGAYVALAIVGALAFALGIGAITSLGRASPRTRATLAFALATAPSFLLALHLAQVSAIWLALLAGSLALWSRGRSGAAGAIAALLLAKPNLAIALVGAMLVLRERRFLGAFAVVGLALVASALPYGAAPWGEWIEATSALAARHDAHAEDLWKQQTLYAAMRAVAGPTAARVGWVIVGTALGAAIVHLLRHLAPRLPADRALAARVASVVALATCALNVYLFYYDTLLLAVAAGALVVGRDAWASATRRRAAIAVGITAWLATAEVAVGRSHPPLVGVIATVWLALEVVDLHAVARSIRAQPSGASDPLRHRTP